MIATSTYRSVGAKGTTVENISLFEQIKNDNSKYWWLRDPWVMAKHFEFLHRWYSTILLCPFFYDYSPMPFFSPTYSPVPAVFCREAATAIMKMQALRNTVSCCIWYTLCEEYIKCITKNMLDIVPAWRIKFKARSECVEAQFSAQMDYNLWHQEALFENLLYVDDIFLASPTRRIWDDEVRRWTIRVQHYGLILSIKKNEHINLGSLTNGLVHVAEPLWKVVIFTYLGMTEKKRNRVGATQKNAEVVPKRKAFWQHQQWNNQKAYRSCNNQHKKTFKLVRPRPHWPLLPLIYVYRRGRVNDQMAKSSIHMFNIPGSFLLFHSPLLAKIGRCQAKLQAGRLY